MHYIYVCKQVNTCIYDRYMYVNKYVQDYDTYQILLVKVPNIRT